jgi:hypothetical protein
VLEEGENSGDFDNDFDDLEDDSLDEEDSDDDEPSMKPAAFTKKAPPGAAPAASSANAPPSVTSPSPKEADVEFLVHRMDKMKISTSEGKGWNFASVHPHYWWTYSFQGVCYCRIKLLVWTSHEDECDPKISKCGNYFYFTQKIPERFLDMARQFSYYDPVQLLGDIDTCTDAIIEQGLNLQNEVKEAFELNSITPVAKLRLPFTVQQAFEDPYRPGALGYELATYPHALEVISFLSSLPVSSMHRSHGRSRNLSFRPGDGVDLLHHHRKGHDLREVVAHICWGSVYTVLSSFAMARNE